MRTSKLTAILDHRGAGLPRKSSLFMDGLGASEYLGKAIVLM
jgi:hypothetical protein